MTWPKKRQDRDNDDDKDKYIKRAPSKSDPRHLWPLIHLIRVMRRHDLTEKKTMTKTNTNTMTKTNTFESPFKEMWSEQLIVNNKTIQRFPHQVIEGVPSSDVIDQKSSSRSSVVWSSDWSECLLTSCVPNLQFDLFSLSMLIILAPNSTPSKRS